MPKLTLPDGRWLVMRLPTVNEHLGIIDLPEAKTGPARTERLRFFRDTLRAATLETSWGGDAGDLSIVQMSKLINPWLRLAEDDAVPPEPGSSSETSPVEQRSQVQTASRR